METSAMLFSVQIAVPNMEFFYYIITAFPLIIMLLTLLFNVLFGPKLKKSRTAKSKQKISILIPARNEETNIEKCLKSLITLDYAVDEIIVLDDNSEDSTSDIVEKFASQYSNVKLIKGKELPKDWLGKNWACHQLASNAKGDIFIFTDADVIFHREAVSASIYLFEKFDLDFLSCFPTQRAKTFWAKLLTPLVDLIAYSGFIFWSSYYIKNKAFIASIGQFLAFKRDAYFQIGGHNAVKNNVVEDMELGRLCKVYNLKTLTASGKGLLFTDMYGAFEDVWSGFSKNLFGIARHKPLLFFPLMLIIINSLFITTLLPFFYFNIYTILLFSLVVVWRLVNIIVLRHSIYTFFLHQLAILIYIGIAINSFYIKYFGKIKWKGRQV